MNKVLLYGTVCSELHWDDHVKRWHFCRSRTIGCSNVQSHSTVFGLIFLLVLVFPSFQSIFSTKRRINNILSCSRECVLVNGNKILVHILKGLHRCTHKCPCVNLKLTIRWFQASDKEGHLCKKENETIKLLTLKTDFKNMMERWLRRCTTPVHFGNMFRRAVPLTYGYC